MTAFTTELESARRVIRQLKNDQPEGYSSLADWAAHEPELFIGLARTAFGEAGVGHEVAEIHTDIITDMGDVLTDNNQQP